MLSVLLNKTFLFLPSFNHCRPHRSDPVQGLGAGQCGHEDAEGSPHHDGQTGAV